MTEKAIRYTLLDAGEIIKTADVLVARIGERFPRAGLRKVALQLTEIARAASQRSDQIARPILWMRALTCLLAATVCAVVIVPFLLFEPMNDRVSFSEFVQVMEAGLNDVVFVGAAILFIFTLESRIKRNRALAALHELRSLAHIIDMHQLTKDPEHLFTRRHPTRSSPQHNLTPFELERYLDYCSEMLSLIGKVAALYVQHFADADAVAAVNDIEELTSGLSRKIWQKIVLIHGIEQAAIAGRSDETPSLKSGRAPAEPGAVAAESPRAAATLPQPEVQPAENGSGG